MEDSLTRDAQLSNPDLKPLAGVEEAITAASEQAIPALGDSTALASVFTAAESVDVDGAIAAAKDVDASETASLSEALSSSGKTLSKAFTQEKNSRKTLHRGLIDVLAAAELSYQHPERLVALAAEKGIKTTKASWRTPFLVPLKIAQPELDNKRISLYARVLNYIAAMDLTGDAAFSFLSEHGVGALAAEEANRQKIRKQGQPATPPEDPVEAFCRTRTPAPLPEALWPAGPDRNIKLASMIVGEHEGRWVAWDLDTDEKRILAAIRQAAKRSQPKGWPAGKVENDDQG